PLRRQPLVLGPEAAEFVLDGGEPALAGERLAALGRQGLPPVADQVLADAEGPRGLGDGVALLGDEPDGFGLELRGVGASRSRHRWTSQGEFTPLTGCPLFVGKSTGFAPSIGRFRSRRDTRLVG